MKKILRTLFAWARDGLSLDETKVSLLMGSYLIFVLISIIYLVRWHTDIPPNLYSLMNLQIIVLGVVTVGKEINSSDGLLDTAMTFIKSKIGS